MFVAVSTCFTLCHYVNSVTNVACCWLCYFIFT